MTDGLKIVVAYNVERSKRITEYLGLGRDWQPWGFGHMKTGHRIDRTIVFPPDGGYRQRDVDYVNEVIRTGFPPGGVPMIVGDFIPVAD